MKKNSLIDRIKNYLIDIILGKVIPLTVAAESCVLFIGWGHATCLAYPRVEQKTEKGIIYNGGMYDIPEWLQIGLKIYTLAGWGIAAFILISSFINKRALLSKNLPRLIFYYLVINLISVLIIEYLYGSRFFS